MGCFVSHCIPLLISWWIIDCSSLFVIPPTLNLTRAKANAKWIQSDLHDLLRVSQLQEGYCTRYASGLGPIKFTAFPSIKIWLALMFRCDMPICSRADSFAHATSSFSRSSESTLKIPTPPCFSLASAHRWICCPASRRMMVVPYIYMIGIVHIT